MQAVADATFENGLNTQLPPDFADVVGLAFEPEGRRSGDNLQTFDGCQGVCDLFADAVAEVFLIAGRAHVDERQDGDRGIGRADGLPAGGRGLQFIAHNSEIIEKLLDRRVAGAGFLLEGAPHDSFEARGQIIDDRRKGGERAVDDVVDHGPGRLAFEGDRSGGKLEEDDSERKDVGAGVDLEPLRLLGRHVGDRALGRVVVRASGMAGDECDAEVSDFDVSVFGEEDVLGFDVTVNDSVAVSMGESGGDLLPPLNDSLGRKRAAIVGLADARTQRATGHELHGHKGLGGAVIDLVDRGHVGMVES